MVGRIGTVGIPSTISLVLLILYLIIPITLLVIGICYRDPRHCPIEPYISLFLIVYGSISLGWHLILCLTSLFSLIWLIVGSVWTLRVYNKVTHEYDRINHFYSI